MSLVFNRTLHTKFWLYIAEHCVDKGTAVSEMSKKGLITAEEEYLLAVSENYCMACEYASKLQDLLYDPYRNMCDFCPLKNINGIACMNGTFSAWQRENMKAACTPFVDAMTKRLVKMFATSIAYWPVRDDVQCI